MDPNIVMLVTGTRNTLTPEHKRIVREKVIEVVNKYGNDPIILVHGDCTGVDKYAAEVASIRKNISIISVKANWEKYGKAAGPIRNKQMLDTYRPHYILAFPSLESKGTYDCINKAKKHQLELGSRVKDICAYILG